MSEIEETKKRFDEGSRLFSEERYAEAALEFEAAETIAVRLHEFFQRVDSCVKKFRALNDDSFVRENHILATIAKDETTLLDMFRSEKSLAGSEETVRMVTGELERIKEGVHAWIKLRTFREAADKRLSSLFDQIEMTVKKAVLSPETKTSQPILPFNIDLLSDQQVQKDLIKLQTLNEEFSVRVRISPFCKLKRTDQFSFEEILCSPSASKARKLIKRAANGPRNMLSAIKRFYSLEESKKHTFELVESLGGLRNLEDRVPSLWDDFTRSIDNERLKRQHWTESSICDEISNAESMFSSVKDELLEIVWRRAEAVKQLLSDYSSGSLQGFGTTAESVLKKRVGEILRWEKLAGTLRPRFSIEWNFQEDPCQGERFNTDNMKLNALETEHVLNVEKMMARAENHPDVACLLSILFREKKEYDTFRGWLEKAAKAGSPCGMNNYGVLLFGQRRYPEAKEWFDKAAQAENKYAVQNARKIRPFVS